MRRRRAIIALAVGCFVLGALPPTGAPGAGAPAPYRLGALKVRLYYPFTGTFSPDIPRGALLFNTVIGEGWAASPSDAVLVQVPVLGARGSFAERRRVRLVVRAPRADGRSRVLLRRTRSVGLIGPRGRSFVGFFAAGTGCARLRVRADLIGQRPTRVRARAVPFVCGE